MAAAIPQGLRLSSTAKCIVTRCTSDQEGGRVGPCCRGKLCKASCLETRAKFCLTASKAALQAGKLRAGTFGCRSLAGSYGNC